MERTMATNPTKVNRPDPVAVSTPVKRTSGVEERLLGYAVLVVRIVEALPQSRVGSHVGGELLRCGMAPLSHHGEAELAESPDDLVHNLRICLRELRAARRWLKLIHRIPLMTDLTVVVAALAETESLISLLQGLLHTARAR